MFQDFIALIYPRNCVSCANLLYKHEAQLCNYCIHNLPKTNFHKTLKNPVEALFYGRQAIAFASSYYLFEKSSGVQKILHHIKYKHNHELASDIGALYGNELKDNELIASAHFIVPVPLHDKKLKIRGFNQSEEFAKGLSLSMKMPINTTILIRKEFTETQTKKNKYQRWENVEDAFELKNPELFERKHIIVVDDVITTGATIEACVELLKNIEGIKISVLSIAYASK